MVSATFKFAFSETSFIKSDSSSKIVNKENKIFKKLSDFRKCKLLYNNCLF